MFKSWIEVACIGTLLLSRMATAHAEQQRPLLDARTAIAQILANDPETKIERAEQALAEHLRSFADRSAKLPPNQAAAQWLALVDEAVALPHRSFFGAMGGAPPQPIGTLYNVLITLPSPEAWPEIKTLAAKRPPSTDRTALLILSDRLTGDDEGILKLCDEYDRKSPSGQGDRSLSPTFSIRMEALVRLGRPISPELFVQTLGNMQSRLDFPNLTDYFPLNVAKEVVFNVLKDHDAWNLSVNPSGKRLARQVTIERLKDLPSPHWEMVDSASDAAFVRRLVERYGYLSLVEPNNRAETAQQAYLRDLAVRGKVEEAAKLVNDCYNVPRLAPEEWGTVKDVDSFVVKLQTRSPHKDLWNLYVSAAIASGHEQGALKRLQAQILDPKTTHESKLNLLNIQFGLHARLGDLRGLAHDCDLSRRIRSSPSDLDVEYQILPIGLLTDDSELIKKGIFHDLQNGYTALGTPLFKALAIQHNFGKLEELQLRQMEQSKQEDQAWWNGAADFCATYYAANRPNEIVKLLKRFPYWPQRDLAFGQRPADTFHLGDEEANLPLGFYGAWALSKTGHTNLAERIIERVLLRDCGWNKCYELLNQGGGAQSQSFYDEVIRAHPLAPMPVLWKGDLLFRLGKTRDAEACVREAAAIDPGGEPAYAEKLNDLMAQILRRKGDAKGARAFVGREVAVRLGARAADLMQQGVLPQARRALQAAILQWPHNFQLQAQLAKCLRQMCLPDEAKQHYKLAFEALPGSMGEASGGPSEIAGMMYDPELKQLGLAVLNNAVGKNPRSAQANLALGLLNLDAGNSKEAVMAFRQAVALDPRSATAWRSLAQLSKQGVVSQEENKKIFDMLIQLDAEPEYEFIPRVDLDGAFDLARAYRAIMSKLQALPTESEDPLFALHTKEQKEPASVFPTFDRLSKRDRFPGFYFKMSGEIASLAQLYHPTRFPFE